MRRLPVLLTALLLGGAGVLGTAPVWAGPPSAAQKSMFRATMVQKPMIHTIVLDKMAFGTMPSSVRRGDIIDWVNRDIFEHTATAKDGQFDIDLPPGTTKSMKVTKSGSVDFFCKFHPGMTGTLLVK